jgi:HD-like signal output (HDOD) protein
VAFQQGGRDASESAAGGPQEQALSARDQLIRKIAAKADLPALGSSVSRVVQMTSSDDEAVRHLAHFILSDVALTQKVLRVANTVCYRTASGSTITTVSKAIFLLGFDMVKTSALAMMLVEGLGGMRAQSVRNELGHALCASIVGREIASRGKFKDVEEAAIAALFKNLGRLLVAAHDHQLYAKIAELVDSGRYTPAQASMEVLGCSFDTLAEAVLHEWNIPETIIHALTPPPPGILKPARGRQEWLQQAAAFSSATARLVPAADGTEQEAATKALLARFGAALGLDRKRLDSLIADVAEEARALSSHLGLSVSAGEPEQASAAARENPHPLQAQDETDSGLPDELLMQIDSNRLQVGERHASGKPINARDLLLAGVQDATQMMASGRCKANELILLVLETLYGGMGFRFAAICLKDTQRHQFRARLALGEDSEARQAGFAFDAESGRDLFRLAMTNDADLMISDASVPKIRDLLPAWHRALLPDARSFIVLPLVVNGRPLGLFYADRTCTAPEGVPPDETALIKTLKGQVLAALNTR